MDMSSAVQVLHWNQKLMSILGLWPLDKNDKRYAFGIMCCLIHLTFQQADLYKFGTTFEHVVANLSINMVHSSVTIRLITLRINSRTLGKVMREVQADCIETNYETFTERKIFLHYHKMARLFIMISVPMTVVLVFLVYLLPLSGVLGTIIVTRNTTVELKLPYHMYVFYDVSKVRPYVLTYAAQLPFVVFVGFGSVAPTCLVASLTFHMCGQLAVLVERINNIKTDGQNCALAIKMLVKQHVRLIRLTKSVDDVFNICMLFQLVTDMILMGILTFYVLASAIEDQTTGLVTFLLYVVVVTSYIFVFCWGGEKLVEESTNIHDALSACPWYDMPSAHAKMLIICMIRAQQPLTMTAGKFYEFTLINFTNILKTSMAYVSVLRNMI
ncbi:uncharacterized protein LOC124406470 [Diprion similis]|uniref:uncharacterized protein LOC124406470 n=1 Tax=Diprion similis TaxID=362088 RepID=UPI001EF75EA6|nr:uncharacterized protein LOC124406470 [Diprion similis]